MSAAVLSLPTGRTRRQQLSRARGRSLDAALQAGAMFVTDSERELLEMNRHMTYAARRTLLRVSIALQREFPWRDDPGSQRENKR